VNIKLEGTFGGKIMQETSSRRSSTDAIGIKEQICFKTVKYNNIANFDFRLNGDEEPVTVIRVGGGN
jgi:hypothetical protein